MCGTRERVSTTFLHPTTPEYFVRYTSMTPTHGNRGHNLSFGIYGMESTAVVQPSGAAQVPCIPCQL